MSKKTTPADADAIAAAAEAEAAARPVVLVILERMGAFLPGAVVQAHPDHATQLIAIQAARPATEDEIAIAGPMPTVGAAD